MIDFVRAPDPASSAAMMPGTWRREIMPWGRSAIACCPHGHVASLYDHEIASDGTVTPSVVCPTPGCSFHDQVRLVGWLP